MERWKHHPGLYTKKTRERTWAYRKRRDIEPMYPDPDKCDALIAKRISQGWRKKDTETCKTDTDRVQTDRVQTSKIQTGKVKTDRVHRDRHQTGKIQTGKVQTDRPHTDRVHPDRVQRLQADSFRRDCSQIFVNGVLLKSYNQNCVKGATLKKHVVRIGFQGIPLKHTCNQNCFKHTPLTKLLTRTCLQGPHLKN